jgi:hypothetical protein
MDDQRTDREGDGIAPRFFLWRFIAAVTVGSLGIAVFMIGFKASDLPGLASLPAMAAACWLVGCPMIGAGLFALFKRGKLGAIIGLAIGFALMVVAQLAMID